jgi:hypothetical protein
MTTPVQVRAELVKALALDLVGPAPDDSAHREEILTQAPSKWYLTSFLAPRGSSDDTAEEGVIDNVMERCVNEVLQQYEDLTPVKIYRHWYY